MAWGLATWQRISMELLHAAHLLESSEVARFINQMVAELGVEARPLLVDREGGTLRALPVSNRPTLDPLLIDDSLAGEAFAHTQITAQRGGGRERIWVPLLDGAERLGVLELTLAPGMSADDSQVRAGALRLSSAVSYLLAAKVAYGDTIRRTRRSQNMSVGGELLWRMLPPLTFTSRHLEVAAALEPCYDVGGDAFDYAADFGVLYVGIFDAIGHGLNAAFTSTLALAATRSARTAGLPLTGMAVTADEAITSQFEDSRFVTAMLAELDRVTGEVRYINAGHPPAVLIRDRQVKASLEAEPRPPLGIPHETRITRHDLQPGDRLLFYTDGIIEARGSNGDFFGLDRLLTMAEEHAAAGLSTAETVRQLSRAVLCYQGGRLDDDATLMIVEWSPDHEQTEGGRFLRADPTR
jgi:sigma-B regulation protein RsbU (phosphoserine phosphatase)